MRMSDWSSDVCASDLRHRPDQVRRQPGEQQATLLEGLLDQPEVEHLQVAQPTVDQLAAAARRPRGEVALLDQPGGESASDRVQRGPGTDHAASDDQDIELTAVIRGGDQGAQGIRAELWTEGARLAHVASVSGLPDRRPAQARTRWPSEVRRSASIGWASRVAATRSGSRSATTTPSSVPRLARVRPSGSWIADPPMKSTGPHGPVKIGRANG